MNERLLEAKKVEALENALKRDALYKDRGYDPKICKSVFDKRVALISNAKSCKDVEEILNGPKPFDDSGITVPEEECFMWSEASLKAPLNSAATERYLKLMENIYGKDVLA